MHVPRPGERTEGSVGLLPTKNLRCPSKQLRRGHAHGPKLRGPEEGIVGPPPASSLPTADREIGRTLSLPSPQAPSATFYFKRVFMEFLAGLFSIEPTHFGIVHLESRRFKKPVKAYLK